MSVFSTCKTVPPLPASERCVLTIDDGCSMIGHRWSAGYMAGLSYVDDPVLAVQSVTMTQTGEQAPLKLGLSGRPLHQETAWQNGGGGDLRQACSDVGKCAARDVSLCTSQDCLSATPSRARHICVRCRGIPASGAVQCSAVHSASPGRAVHYQCKCRCTAPHRTA